MIVMISASASEDLFDPTTMSNWRPYVEDEAYRSISIIFLFDAWNAYMNLSFSFFSG